MGSGVGTLNIATAGSGPTAYLNGISSSDVDFSASVRLDKVPTGGTNGVDLSLVGRRVSGVGDYRGKVRVLPGGGVRVSIARVDNAGAATSIRPETLVAGLTYAVGDTLNVRFQAAGTSPTQLAVKVWKAGTTEPATWQLSGPDSFAGLQVNGSVGVQGYLSGSVTNSPINTYWDGILVRRASTL